MTDAKPWEPVTGEWVLVRGPSSAKHAKVTRRTPTQARIGDDVYRREEWAGHTDWRRRMYLDSFYLEPATRPQAELEAEWMTQLREGERRRLWREAEAHLLDAHKRGDDDAIRRAIHELEKGSKR